MGRTSTGIAVLAAVCAAAFAGCGGGDDNGKDTEVGRAAQKYVDAYNARDFKTVCSLLSESYKDERQLGPGGAVEPEEGELRTGCPQYFDEHTSGAATRLTLLDAEQRGQIGTAHLRSESEDTPAGEAELNMGLAREPNGTWQVTDLSPFSEGSS
jgi:hypothetical protein